MHFNCVAIAVVIYMASHWTKWAPRWMPCHPVAWRASTACLVSNISLTLIDFNQPQDMRPDDKDNGNDNVDDMLLWPPKLQSSNPMRIAGGRSGLVFNYASWGN